METVFDYAASEEELQLLRVLYNNKNEYLLNATPYIAYLDLSLLHKYRGNIDKYRNFMKKACESFPESQQMILKRFFNMS